MYFSPMSDMLAVGSSSGTVHIFSIEAAAKKGAGSSGSTAPLPAAVSAPGPAALAQASADNSSLANSSSATQDANSTTWGESIKSSTISVFGFVQNWSFSTVSSLNVLPEDMQEFADSCRASSLARIPGAEGNFKAAIISVPGKIIKTSFFCTVIWGIYFLKIFFITCFICI